MANTGKSAAKCGGGGGVVMEGRRGRCEEKVRTTIKRLVGLWLVRDGW